MSYIVPESCDVRPDLDDDVILSRLRRRRPRRPPGVGRAISTLVASVDDLLCCTRQGVNHGGWPTAKVVWEPCSIWTALPPSSVAVIANRKLLSPQPAHDRQSVSLGVELAEIASEQAQLGSTITRQAGAEVSNGGSGAKVRASKRGAWDAHEPKVNQDNAADSNLLFKQAFVPPLRYGTCRRWWLAITIP